MKPLPGASPKAEKGTGRTILVVPPQLPIEGIALGARDQGNILILEDFITQVMRRSTYFFGNADLRFAVTRGKRRGERGGSERAKFLFCQVGLHPYLR